MEPGDIAFLTKDIFIDGQLAFSDNEKVIVEKVQGNEQCPEYKYVVVSKRLLKRFQLREEDLRIGNKETVGEPTAIREPLNEMLKIQKRAEQERKKAKDTRTGYLVLAPFAGAFIVGVILIGIVVYRHWQLEATVRNPVPWGIFFDFNSWAYPCLILGILATLAGLGGFLFFGLYTTGAVSSKLATEPCPHCGEMVFSSAVVCKFCKKTIRPQDRALGSRKNQHPTTQGQGPPGVYGSCLDMTKQLPRLIVGTLVAGEESLSFKGKQGASFSIPYKEITVAAVLGPNNLPPIPYKNKLLSIGAGSVLGINRGAASYYFATRQGDIKSFFSDQLMPKRQIDNERSISEQSS